MIIMNTITKTIIKLRLNAELHTDGRGYWTREKRAVTHKRAVLCWYDYDDILEGGELRVYFAKKHWAVKKLGLIYTDKTWVKELKRHLVMEMGFTRKEANDVEYSEQGMQGANYVSLDCGSIFQKAVIDRTENLR